MSFACAAGVRFRPPLPHGCRRSFSCARRINTARTDALRLPDRRIPARPAAARVLVRGVDAGGAMDADAGAFLQRAAGRRADPACDWPRIRSRQLPGAAARVLAGRDRLPPRRFVRTLPAGAGVHRRHLLAVFTLGRAVVGTRHAVLAVLLMVGIAAFTVPSPDFGPGVLAAPLWALALMHYWRALGEDRRGAWFLLAIDLGLLLLASYVGAILVLLLVAFTPLSRRGRAALRFPEPWLALVLLAIILLPHVWWLVAARDLVLAGIGESVAAGKLAPGLRLLAALIGSHLGLLLLIALASGWPRRKGERAPEINRAPVNPLARRYVYAFAFMPAVAALAVAVVGHRVVAFDRIAPLVVLSGLAAILAAGDRALLYRERATSSAWLGLLFAPPAMVVLALALLPWIGGVDPRVAQPAADEGAFFADSYQRRTGRPLLYVTGDPRVAPLVALGARSRPHVYFAWAPERSPWASAEDVREQGGVVVWRIDDNATAPPPALKALFPEMVPEVPRFFARPVQGTLPLIRIGWAVIRPREAGAAPPVQ